MPRGGGLMQIAHGTAGRLEAELAHEQSIVDRLYERLDQLRDQTRRDLAATRRQRVGGNLSNQRERDAFSTMYENRLAQLMAVEDRLCFGRLDHAGGERQYIGRLGLADDEQRRLLVDWRAHAATPFYQATAAHPGDVVARRHLFTSGRSVEGVEDDVLDLDALDSAELTHLNGEGALMAAVSAQRTGRMGDIVATIQTEQDAIIRSQAAGVMVVQGGPGTGKTAVALHRAAYLLYTHRDRLARSGVLVIGPSAVFMRYIERVLPSLGETGVVMMTAGELFPGLVASRHDSPEVSRLKGDAQMAEALRRAIGDRQRVPDAPVVLNVEGTRITLTPRAVEISQQKARLTGKPHNEARVSFVKDMLAHLADLVARHLGSRLSPEDRSLVIADLRGSVDVRRALNLAWMPVTPQDVLARLLSDERRLLGAAPWLTTEQRSLLLRPRGAEFTVEDVPLLDELAEIIGFDDSAAVAAAKARDAERNADLEYAKGVLAMTGTGGMLSSDALADRFAENQGRLTLSERAATDRTWAFGHVVIDEAQEFSAMMWRLVGRRNPTRSMTVVGDLAQTRSAAGAESWAAVLAPIVGDRWRQAELTVSYRTPAQIMRLAAAVLTESGEAKGIQAPTSVREGDTAPLFTSLPNPMSNEVSRVLLGSVLAAELEAVDGGRLAAIVGAEHYPAVMAAASQALRADQFSTGAGALDAPVAILTVEEAKGLEFDSVVLVEPSAIIASGLRGVNDLYVAMTRPTRRLHIVHHEPLPAPLQGAASADL